jgi:hypothetical protein
MIHLLIIMAKNIFYPLFKNKITFNVLSLDWL